MNQFCYHLPLEEYPKQVFQGRVLLPKPRLKWVSKWPASYKSGQNSMSTINLKMRLSELSLKRWLPLGNSRPRRWLRSLWSNLSKPASSKRRRVKTSVLRQTVLSDPWSSERTWSKAAWSQLPKEELRLSNLFISRQLFHKNRVYILAQLKPSIRRKQSEEALLKE